MFQSFKDAITDEGPWLHTYRQQGIPPAVPRVEPLFFLKLSWEVNSKIRHQINNDYTQNKFYDEKIVRYWFLISRYKHFTVRQFNVEYFEKI